MIGRALQGRPEADDPDAPFWRTVGLGALAGFAGYGVPHLAIFTLSVYAIFLAPVCLLVGPLIGAMVGGIAVALSLALLQAPTPGGRFLFQCLLAALGALTYFHGEMLEGALLGHHADASHASLLEYYTSVIGDFQGVGFLYIVFAPLMVVGAFTSFRLGGCVTRQGPGAAPPSLLRATHRSRDADRANAGVLPDRGART